MTTDDPRSRDLPSPTSPGEDGGREPTQSLSVDPDEHGSPALAVGTHNRPITRIESPSGRGKPQGPPGARAAPPGLRADDPSSYLDAVLGSYRVLELLGKGGMGYVFRAEHKKLGREVALKLLRNDYASRRDAVARFFQEARTVNRVRHRNIVDVTDFVELDDGTTYIVMELLTGTSLGAWAHAGVDLPRALAVLVQICDGLGAAHQVGVVHRDLKPDNVIIVPTSDGAELVKLLDFGVAKLLNRDDEDVGFQTAAGSVIGTPAYMSPEQAGGMEVDARSDIYSLGAIMYELFCGQPMFRGKSFGEYVRKHLTEMPVPPHQTPGGAAIDPRLEALIVRCLDKDPDQRFAHIAELRECLLLLLGGHELPLAEHVGLPRPGTIPRTATGPRSRIAELPLPPPQPTHVSQVSPGWQASRASPPSAGPGLPVHISGAYPPPLTLSGEYSLPPPPSSPTAAPTWIWFAGGVAAIAVGVAAAIWYAGRSEHDRDPRPPPASTVAAAPQAQPAPPPTALPIESPPPPARGHLIEVRFDARPSGRVFAEGSAAELCQTPCAFDIDLADGGPADHRVFAVRRAGYVDRLVTVDLTGTQREFQVTLQRTTSPAPAGRAAAGPGGGKSDGDRHTGKHPARPPRKDARDAAGRAARDAAERDSDAAASEPSPARPAQPARPDDERTPPAPVPAIDPSDTLDPFQRKK